jgi:hypothetical protein
MRWVGHVANNGEVSNVYKTEESLRNRPFQRPACGFEDNIHIDLKMRRI